MKCQGGTQAVRSLIADGIVRFRAMCFGCTDLEQEGEGDGGG